MLATAETFGAMTRAVLALSEQVCGGRLVMAHEGGYSETYVPFCGHAVIAAMAGSQIEAPDPSAAIFAARQPGAAFDRFVLGEIEAMAHSL
jgi:acetoin utilization deacetylase AcuC-like enzyme